MGSATALITSQIYAMLGSPPLLPVTRCLCTYIHQQISLLGQLELGLLNISRSYSDSVCCGSLGGTPAMMLSAHSDFTLMTLSMSSQKRYHLCPQNIQQFFLLVWAMQITSKLASHSYQQPGCKVLLRAANAGSAA